MLTIEDLLPRAFEDLHNMPEDDRIRKIGSVAMEQRKRVGFLIEVSDIDPDKSARYIQKLKQLFPSIVLISQNYEPAMDAFLVVVGPPAEPVD